MNKFTKFILIVILIFVVSIPSYAEGGGNRATADDGINRRVVSDKGYTGVKGTFTFSSENVQVPAFPTNKKLLAYFKGLDYFKNDHDQNNNPTTHHLTANVNRSLPTGYLGSTGPAEADAGIQYYNGDRYDAGWGAFIKAGSGSTSTPKVFANGSWHGVHSSASSFGLKYYIDEIHGSVWLKASGLSGIDKAFPYPTDPTRFLHIEGTDGDVFPYASDALPDIYNPNDLDKVSVKRVIGITQGARTGQDSDTFTYALDGSIATLTYTGGMVREKGSTWIDWTPTIVNQTKTGYDVDEDAKDAQLDGKDTSASQYILTFPNISDTYYTKVNKKMVKHTLADGKGSEDARETGDISPLLEEKVGSTYLSRYVHETVKISLRSATKITGTTSTVRGAN